MYEGQRDQLYQQQFNVEQTKFTVDSIKDTVSTVQAMTAASKEMKNNFKKTKELDINYIDKMNGEALSRDEGPARGGYDLASFSQASQHPDYT